MNNCVQTSHKRKKEVDDEKYIPQIGIIFDPYVHKQFNKLPQLNLRGELVHSLIESYDLLRNMTLYTVKPATSEELINFHSSDYIEYLKSINSLYTPDDTVELDYGLGYDCPPLDGIYDYVAAVAGSTLTAARALLKGEVDICINWNGGWHHAHRDEASGFCYVNDIVLAILELSYHYDLILYVDLDIHHGDGVEESFQYSNNVATFSLHKCEPGFFPGTGKLNTDSTSLGKSIALNVPLKDGITDKAYCYIFDSVLGLLLNEFNPDAIVVQCGADGLSGDPLGGFCLTSYSLIHCLSSLLTLKKPTLVLGGGGYNLENAARCWTSLTASIIGIEIDEDIPEHKFFTKYGPSYDLIIRPCNRKDENTTESIQLILNVVKKYLEKEKRS